METGVEIRIMKESGYEEALYGISLNKLQPVENMPRVALALSKADAGSHRKFLRQIAVWLEITAPMYLWAEIDTLKIGTTRNSSSTMHKPEEHSYAFRMSPLILPPIKEAYDTVLELYTNGAIDIETLKANMPAGVLLTSVLSLNYEVLRTILNDRWTHKLQSWRFICDYIYNNVEHPELLPKSVKPV